MSTLDAFWLFLGFWTHLAGALACTLAAVYVWRSGQRYTSEGAWIAAALGLTALWCLMVVGTGPISDTSFLAETVRNLGWLAVLHRLFRMDGRDRSVRQVMPVLTALAFVELLQPVVLVVAQHAGAESPVIALAYNITGMFRILFVVGALVLLHNLYVGAPGAQRGWLRWPTAAMGAMWVYELNLYTIAYLGNSMPLELATLRGLVITAIAVPLVLGYTRKGRELVFRPSRMVAFQSLSLLVIGGYLVMMVGVAQALSALGSDVARLTQIGFIFAASVVALLWLPSQKLRGWLRVTVLKHLFQHRYDYREEWLRFTRTLARGEDHGQPLAQRLVQALADITDSPGGLLLVPDEDGMMLAARWRWDDIDVPANALTEDIARFFEEHRFIVDLDGVRQGTAPDQAAQAVPDWLREDAQSWAIVPLVHYNWLVGLIILSRPEGDRRLDWEDFDLLRVVGQQLASYLAERESQEALGEAARFDEFNRRIAFVMHDIKNLASQLSLLARNAEKHADNPDFRADMLVTLRNSSDKLNALLARLGRYGAGGMRKERESVRLDEIAARIAKNMGAQHPVTVTQADETIVSGDAEAIEQALTHLVQNAFDASQAGAPVFLSVHSETPFGTVEIVDSGTGMSADFVHSKLFKPFQSSKEGGFGIGAYEARELVRAMGGRLDVESREGLGTRFVMRIPLEGAKHFYTAHGGAGAADRKEVA